MSHLSRIAPELPVSNVAESIKYYEARLGFRAAMTMPDGDYAIVERDDVAIHLFRSAEGNAPGSIHVFANELDELHAELEKRGARISQSVERKPWGTRDFRVLDDSGNEIKFTEPLSEG